MAEKNVEEEMNVSGSMEIPIPPSSGGFFNLPRPFMTPPDAREWIGQRKENVRPWSMFINTSNFKVPSSLPRLSKRIMKNIEYFQSNYLFVFIGLIIYCFNPSFFYCHIFLLLLPTFLLLLSVWEALVGFQFPSHSIVVKCILMFPYSVLSHQGFLDLIELLTSPLLLIAIAVSLFVGYKLSKKQNERKLVVLGHEVTLAQQYGAVAICSIPIFIWAGAGAAVFWVLGASLVILRTRASEIYTTYIRTVGLALIGFIIVLRTVVIDFLFFFCLYYIGASFFIITLHAAFFNIEAILKTEDSFGLLEEV